MLNPLSFNRQSSIVNRQLVCRAIDEKNGQIAVVLLILMVFMVFLAKVMVSVGQVAQMRLETSNAADAGALAAASWIASGQNEAAMIAQKMWKSIDAVQRLIESPSEPFCPGSNSYAAELWHSLEKHPDTSHVPLEGPLIFFIRWANGAMEAGWRMGRREFLTAAVNNMLIRFNRTSGGAALSLAPQDYEEVEVFGDLPEQIRLRQDELYSTDYQGAVPPIKELDWNNGKPIDDPWHITHRPIYTLESYPLKAPTLSTGKLTATFYVWCYDSLHPVSASPRCHCADLNNDEKIDGQDYKEIFDNEGNVVLRGVVNTIKTGPFVDMAKAEFEGDLNVYEINPLKVGNMPGDGLMGGEANPRKLWDFALQPEVIPGNLAEGLCPKEDFPVSEFGTGQACLGQFEISSNYAVPIPLLIINETKTVQVSVEHTVYAQDSKMRQCPGGGGKLGALDACFPTVKSTANARFTEAEVGEPLKALRTANAELIKPENQP